jgi:acetate kinase
MKILVINSGSSSLKFELFETNGKHKQLYRGIIDRIGLPNTFTVENGKEMGETSIKNHTEAVGYALKILQKKGLINNLKDIKAVGHRVVHGGEKYKNATLITPDVLKEIKILCELAPLHNPPNLAAIHACMEHLKNTPQVAVFDTAFHQTIPEKAYLYAIPYDLYKKYGIRRYGFHGTSHSYIAGETTKLLKKKKSKIIVCHLGNGCSITAIENGKSIDTSMGFTPLEGLPMGTRCGDIDPAIVFELQEILKIDTNEIDVLLNKESGLKGISGISSDMRDLWAKCKKNKRAKLAISILAYRTAKYIGAYSAALRGLDAITFTAGMGEKAYYLRKEICDYLPHLGVKIDSKKNKKCALKISDANSKVKVFVMPTNEEKQIAIETAGIIKRLTKKRDPKTRAAGSKRTYSTRKKKLNN